MKTRAKCVGGGTNGILLLKSLDLFIKHYKKILKLECDKLNLNIVVSEIIIKKHFTTFYIFFYFYMILFKSASQRKIILLSYSSAIIDCF